MSSATHKPFMPVIDFEKIPIKDFLPPPTSTKQNISFLQLPCELRHYIYCDSIATGNFGILRLNKFINEEASQLLLKHATLRINMGYVNRTNWPGLSSASITPVVQHVDLRIKTGLDALPLDFTLISGLLDKQVIRESCTVTLDYGKARSPNLRYVTDKAFYGHLARLDTFKKVVFKIVIHRHVPSDFQAVISEEDFHRIFHYDTHLLCYHEDCYLEMQSYLKHHLGPATFDDSVEGHCLEFHPLEPVPGWSPVSTAPMT